MNNPRVAAFLDCLPEAQGLPKELRDSFLRVAAKAKYQASHWEAVPDEFSLLGAGGGGSLAPVARMLAKLWPQKGPGWVMCIRQHAMETSTTDPNAAARTAESGVGAQAPPTETPGEASAAGNTDVGERFFVGDIVRIEGSVGKLYQGEEAQVTKITKKTMVVVLTTGKHIGKTRP